MATAEPVREDRQTRPFADFLAQQRRGQLGVELSTEFQRLIEAVTAHTKKGTITLKITVAPAKADGMVEITDTVKVDAPHPARPASIFFVDDDSNLSREDPRQQSFGLHAAPEPSATGTDGGTD